MHFARSAAFGLLSVLLTASSVAVLCLGCATRGRGPGASAPEPPATIVSTSVGAADASRGDALSLDAPDASSAETASGAAAAGTSEEITPEQLREGLAWRAPAAFRVQRVVRQAGGLDDEVSSGILTLDAQGTVVWSLDGPALHLSTAGYEIQTQQTCADARRSFSIEWLALAPLQPASTGDFRLYRVSGEGAGVGYAAKQAETYLSRQIDTHVVYRPLGDAGLEATVLQRWGVSRWRTFRYELRPADESGTSRQKVAFAPCARDAGPEGGPTN